METITKEIQGVEYTAIYKGKIFSDDCIRKCTINNFSDTKLLSNSLITDLIFNEVIINPKTSVDDFDDLDILGEVVEFGKSVLFGTYVNKTRASLKKEVLNEWDYWRLIYCDMANFDYNTVFNQMSVSEIKKANIALDIVEEEIKKQSKNKK